MTNLKKYIAECIGTFVLVFFACGTAVLSGDWVAIALAFGLVIIAMAFSIGNISGCHINPAVSLAFFLRGELSLADFLGYICSQFIGGILGATLLGCFLRDFRLLGGNQVAMVNNNGDLDAWSYIGGFLVEVILTFVFVLVILFVTDKKRTDGKFAGIYIGLTLTLVHLLGIGFTGTSVNPARSFGPALLQAFAGNWRSLSQVWIWLIAPCAGAFLAAFLYSKVFDKSDDKKAEKKEAPKAEKKAEEKAEEPAEEKAE